MTALPTGTVTLLFTDIEGSSRLWDEHRSEMAAALAKHNELLRAAVAGNGGHIVKDKGDGFFAAFERADNAIGCAVEGQRSLADADWPDELGRLKVRMAIHTGSVESDGGDYRGPTVNRVARLEGIAHGGQVVVSEATRGLVGGSLADDVTLVELGSYSLRGMARPENVYQLCAPGLADEFPPLRTDSGGGVPLPSYPTSFVGRAAERDSIDQMFTESDARLVTLLGPGGIGKTRLAVESAREIGERLEGGVFFADLARLSDSGDVGLAIAEAVGAHTEGTASPVALAAARLGQPAMLVLDNFEHVQEAATIVAELLEASNQVRLIATSRAPLHIRGERIFRVEPLGSVNGDGSLPPAVALFYERAAGYGVQLPAQGPEADAAKTIVQRLDGLPLAIELVAARTRLLGVGELATMLSESLDALGSGAADMPARQRTIRATIEWSLQALAPQQRDLFNRLSVFPAGATLSQLRAVTSAGGDVLDDLTALVDNSLINVVTGLPGGTRYRQLILLRDYGSELLRNDGTYDETMGRLVEFYEHTSQKLAARLQNEEAAHHEIRADHANLLAAMMWSLGNEHVGAMVDVIGAIWVYWFNGDLATNCSEWVSRADPVFDSPKLDFLTGLLALQAGDGEVAVNRFGLAAERFAEAGEEVWAARSRTFLAFFVEDPEEGLALAAGVAEFFDESTSGIDLFMSRLMLSAFYLQQGRVDEGIALRRQVLAWSETMDYTTMMAWAHWNLAIGLLFGEQLDEAYEHNRRSMDLMFSDGYQEGTASAVDIAAVIWMHRGEVERGLRLLGGAETVWETLGAVRWPEATFLVDTAVAAAKETLGEAEVERLVASGRDLTLEKLVELSTG